MKSRIERKCAATVRIKEEEIEKLEMLAQEQQHEIHTLQLQIQTLTSRSNGVKKETVGSVDKITEHAFQQKQEQLAPPRSHELMTPVLTKPISVSEHAASRDFVSSDTNASLDQAMISAQSAPSTNQRVTGEEVPRRKRKSKPLWAEYTDPATSTPYYHNR